MFCKEMGKKEIKRTEGRQRVEMFADRCDCFNTRTEKNRDSTGAEKCWKLFDFIYGDKNRISRVDLEARKETYSWIECRLHAHEKSISQKLKGFQQICNYVRKTPGKENPNVLGSFLCDSFFASFFKITFQIMPKQKYAKQNRICLVKYFCAEVPCPSEVPRFVRELILFPFF